LNVSDSTTPKGARRVRVFFSHDLGALFLYWGACTASAKPVFVKPL